MAERASKRALALEEALAAQRRAEQLVAEMRNQLSQWLSANRQTMEVALRGFSKLASITGHKVPQTELKFMQAFATAEPTPMEVLKAMKEASPKFEVWVSEALAKYAASFPKDGTPAPAVEVPTKEPEAPEAPQGKEVVYKGDPKEVQELKRITQRQQEEISKLLLTIDELRKRMENIKVVSLDAGPGVAGTVDNIMEKVGLKDIMEAGLARNPPVLKGVFERLYSDATQRIQRYGLIRQQMLLANKAYAAVVEAVASEEEQQWPDFERLNDTTDATIRGMWYHTEYLFRSACEYAMTQGVEATLVKSQQNLVSEFEEKFQVTATVGLCAGAAPLAAAWLRCDLSRAKAASRRSRLQKVAKLAAEKAPNVARLRLDGLEGFRHDFFEAFSEEDFLWNALKDPARTERAVTRSFKLVVKWLPEEALHEVQRLLVDSSSAPALLLSGLPLDSEIPPTPMLPGDFRLPVAEAWLLGLARCLGLPYGLLGFYTENARGGLIRDLAPKPGLGGINQPHIQLGFHRDVPKCVSGAQSEPDGFILLAARGDPQHGAKTQICSHRRLAACLTSDELQALRRRPVRVECVRPDGVSPYGQPFYAVTGSENEPEITLFYIPDHKEFSYRIVSEDAETQAAYSRALAAAAETCDDVDLQAGDALLIDNARCNHARTAFEPQQDGTDRWLLKTFVCAGGWQRPRPSASLTWPGLLVQESFSPAAPRREKPPGPPRRQERGIKEEASRRSELPSKRRPDEPTPFMSYMAALREVQGQLAKEVVQSLPEKPRHGTRALDEFRTLKDACDRPPMALPTSTTSSLATSRSLPALPKTRGLQGGLQEPEAVPSPLTKAKMAATMMT
ncbi:Clavaminate synthase 1 [Symbiodinium microadriaticum]|uniref:Clavaminate synthase 1 n=1 Tax=Symbiodinium microadriaticum TaxID=2951 RepID=A0A1Q9CQX0_SYMMI|nr:Clavaminate synthase 1 [Symbiodinium microadriaticum]